MKNLTKYERLVLSNQYQIMAMLDPENADTFYFNKIIIDKGYELLYDSIFSEIDNPLTDEECREVYSIFQMYRSIKFSFETFHKNDKALDIDIIDFKGYDMFSEKQFFFAEFIVKEMGEYPEFYENLRANTPMLNSYKNILPIYTKAINEGRVLSNEDLKEMTSVFHLSL